MRASRAGRKKVAGWYEEAFVVRLETVAVARGGSLNSVGIEAVNRALAAAGQTARATVGRVRTRRIAESVSQADLPAARLGMRQVACYLEEDAAWACKAMAAGGRQSVEEWFRQALEAEIDKA